jgi:hypothetical protein
VFESTFFEIFFRAYLYYKNNTLSLFTGYLAQNNDISITQFDDVLGYVPKPLFDSAKIKNWQMGYTSIDDKGFRNNGNNRALKASSKILAIGDSFTFGYQVSDVDTWPSCLEKKVNARVYNGGVFGYGPAQSVLRAEQLFKTEHYDQVILSILIGSGFPRDQLSFRSGFSKPAVIVFKNEEFKFSQPILLDDLISEESLFMNAQGKLRNTSFIANSIMDLLNITPAAPRMSIRHKNAANINEIIYFTINKFSHLYAKKIIVLQFAESSAEMLTEEDKYEINLINEIAKQNGIEVLNTLSIFKKYSKDQVWDGHNTPLGNSLICELLAKTITEN